MKQQIKKIGLLFFVAHFQKKSLRKCQKVLDKMSADRQQLLFPAIAAKRTAFFFSRVLLHRRLFYAIASKPVVFSFRDRGGSEINAQKTRLPRGSSDHFRSFPSFFYNYVSRLFALILSCALQLDVVSDSQRFLCAARSFLQAALMTHHSAFVALCSFVFCFSP